MGLALALTGGGVAAAAGRSLPGEPLYPVKRFGQSVRLALDPGSDVAPSLRLVSERISDAERTAAADPGGTDSQRWRALDSALSDADSRLVRLSASAPAQQLSAALAPDRARLDRLLPLVPAAHQDAVRQLRDTMDGLAAVPPLSGSGSFPLGLLSSGGLSPTDALANGWPLDPALLRPSPPPPAAGQQSKAATPSGVSSQPSRATSSAAARPTGGKRSSTTAAPSTLPRLPAGSSSGSGGSSSTSSTGVLPRTNSGIGGTVDRTVSGAVGGTGGRSTSTRTGTGTTAVGGVVDSVVGDATDTVGRLPVVNGLSGSTTTR